MSRLNGLRVYLAGSMEYAVDSGVSWREYITPKLKELGLIVFDPTNRPVKLSYADSASEEIEKLKQLRANGEFDLLTKYVKELVHQDLRMVNISDIIIIGLDTSIPSFGTIDEFATACKEKKPILFCCKQGKKALPLWFWGRSIGDHNKMIFDNFDTLLARLSEVASCDEKDLHKIIDINRWFFINKK